MKNGGSGVGGHDRRVSDPVTILQAGCLGRQALLMTTLPERAVRWAVETGLGPLLARAVAHDPDAAASPLWPLVEGATLTARLLTTQLLGAMTDILDAGRADTPPPVLLKGISLCDQHYPEPHLRPMRDIDFLVEEAALPAAESTLRRLGYRQWSTHPAAFYEGHHHSSPFVHPDTGVWVEVHRTLFASRGKLGSHWAFRPENVGTQVCWSQFRGRAVRRLSDELQIVHVACHWARGLRVVGGMVAMADLALLLNNNPALDWELILKWTGTSPASRYLCLLLTYLDKHQIIELAPGIARRLAGMPTSPGPLTLRIVHSMLDHYVVGGHDFGLFMSERNFNRLWKVVVLGARPRRRGLRRWIARPAPAVQAGNDGWSPGRAEGGEVEPGGSENTVRRGVMSMRRSGAATASHGSSPLPDAAEGRTDGASTSLYPRRRSGVRVRAVDGEVLILDRQQQLVHQVNETARFIWDRCDGRHTMVHIADELAEAFDVDPVIAERDVAATVRQLGAVGLVETRTGWAGAEAQTRRLS
jgi:hypothetical protein